MTHRTRIPILMLLACALAACSSTEEPVVATDGALEPERDAPAIGTGGDVPEPALLDPNRVVARVNDQTLTVRSIQAQFGPLLRTMDIESMSEDSLRSTLEQLTLRLIADRLFLEAARKMGISVSKEEMEQIRERYEEEAIARGTTFEADLAARGIPLWVWEDEQRMSVVRDRFIYMALGRIQPVSPETRARFDVFVSPAEVREWYERHPDDFRQQEEAKLAAIYVRDRNFGGDMDRAREEARSLAGRARGGEPFANLVEEVHGDEPLSVYEEPFDRETGADRFHPDVREFAWTVQVGSVSDPIRLASGWLVLKLERRREARTVPFAEARERIRDDLWRLKMDVGRLNIQLDLLEDAVVTPRRFKNRIREGLEEEIGRLLDVLHG